MVSKCSGGAAFSFSLYVAVLGRAVSTVWGQFPKSSPPPPPASIGGSRSLALSCGWQLPAKAQSRWAAPGLGLSRAGGTARWHWDPPALPAAPGTSGAFSWKRSTARGQPPVHHAGECGLRGASLVGFAAQRRCWQWGRAGLKFESQAAPRPRHLPWAALASEGSHGSAASAVCPPQSDVGKAK